MNTANHDHQRRAEAIARTLAKTFIRVKALETRPESNGAFRCVFALTPRGYDRHLVATFSERAPGGTQAVVLKLHTIDRSAEPVELLASEGGIGSAMLATEFLDWIVEMLDELHRQSEWSIGTLRVSVKPASSLGAALSKHFPQRTGANRPAGEHPAVTEPAHQPEHQLQTTGRLLAAAKATGRARVVPCETPAPEPMPSTMAELRRLGERTRIRLDGEGPRYDFDEVP